MKRLSVAAPCAGILVLLAACGGSPSSTPATTSASTPGAASSAPASPSSPAPASAAASGTNSSAGPSASQPGPAASSGAASGSQTANAGSAGTSSSQAPDAAGARGVASGSAAASPSASGSVNLNVPAPAGGAKLTVAPDSSEMAVNMRELLVGNAAKTPATEKTKSVEGIILLDAQGNVLPGSQIDMDLRTLKSDRSQRDRFIQGRSVLDTAQFPTVEFVPTQVQGLGGLPPASGQKTFKLIGNATVHGVTKPLTFDVTATFNGQGCQGQASSNFTLTEFGMQPPKVGPVLEVEDQGQLAFNFTASKAA